MNRAISRRGMRKTECETRSCPTDPADTNFDLVKMVNVRDIEEDTQLEKLSVVETNSIGSVPNDGPGSPESRNLSPVEICPTTPESRRGHRHLAIVTPPPCAKGGSGEEEERERQSVRVEVDDGDDQDVTGEGCAVVVIFPVRAKCRTAHEDFPKDTDDFDTFVVRVGSPAVLLDSITIDTLHSLAKQWVVDE